MSLLHQILSMSKTAPASPPQDLCPTCGSALVIRHGKFGDFIGCERFPECRYTTSVFEHSGKLSGTPDTTVRRYVEIATPPARPDNSTDLVVRSGIQIKTGPALVPEIVERAAGQKKARRYMNKKTLQAEFSQEKLLKEEVWTSDETAAYLKISKHKLQQMRQLGTGPDFIRFGRHVRYEREKVLEWWRGQKKKPM